MRARLIACIARRCYSPSLQTMASAHAVIFDFNGVLADDEGPHLLAFQQALREQGLHLPGEEYYGTYLGMDERTCLAALLTSQTGRFDRELAARIHARKAALFREHFASHKPPLFPGVVPLIEALRPHYRLAIASGASRAPTPPSGRLPGRRRQ